MERLHLSQKSLLVKIFLMGIIALIMLIPLMMVNSQINERSAYHSESVREITSNWGGAQTVDGPELAFTYPKEKISFLQNGSGTLSEKRTEMESASGTLMPDSLHYSVSSVTEVLHRSVFKVPVYTAKVHVEGNFIASDELLRSTSSTISLKIGDLKGIQGKPEMTLGGKSLNFRSNNGAITADFPIEDITLEGESIPFSGDIEIRGSESLLFYPEGNLTSVEMTSNYPDPSFTGEFLPTERSVNDDGFSASWVVSQINRDNLANPVFGVRLIDQVSQYRQTERSLKYGLLVIFLVFLAGLVVEFASGRPINLIQYIVIGASLVLFYSILLAFTEFLSFGVSYIIAMVMTVGALTWYFHAIVKSNLAFVLGGLITLCYIVIYVLLSMKTFSFLAGTLLLFAILCVVMRITSRMQMDDPFSQAKKMNKDNTLPSE